MPKQEDLHPPEKPLEKTREIEMKLEYQRKPK